MAGLLIRGILERCLIIAPGSLAEKWQDELHDKFDLAFEILSRAQMEGSLTGNPFAEHPRLIARLDMLARNDEFKARLEAAPVAACQMRRLHRHIRFASASPI